MVPSGPHRLYIAPLSVLPAAPIVMDWTDPCYGRRCPSTGRSGLTSRPSGASPASSIFSDRVSREGHWAPLVALPPAGSPSGPSSMPHAPPSCDRSWIIECTREHTTAVHLVQGDWTNRTKQPPMRNRPRFQMPQRGANDQPHGRAHFENVAGAGGRRRHYRDGGDAYRMGTVWVRLAHRKQLHYRPDVRWGRQHLWLQHAHWIVVEYAGRAERGHDGHRQPRERMDLQPGNRVLLELGRPRVRRARHGSDLLVIRVPTASRSQPNR